MSSRMVYICCEVLLLGGFVLGFRVDNCKVGFSKSHFDLQNVDSNFPKKDEVIRSKAFLKTGSIYISVSDINREIVFGSMKNTSTYAIFKSRLDFENGENACDPVSSGVFWLNTGAYMEIVFVLEKTGQFTVIVNDGQIQTALTCKTGYSFGSLSSLSISLSHASSSKIFFDC
ncbi:hypothetical protein ACFFRR_010607 [Megaselia abdita]